MAVVLVDYNTAFREKRRVYITDNYEKDPNLLRAMEELASFLGEDPWVTFTNYPQPKIHGNSYIKYSSKEGLGEL